MDRQQEADIVKGPTFYNLAREAITGEVFDPHLTSGASAPAARRAGKAAAIADDSIEAAWTEEVIASDTDQKRAVIDQPMAAAAFFLSREQVIFHFPDHKILPLFFDYQQVIIDSKAI